MNKKKFVAGIMASMLALSLVACDFSATPLGNVTPSGTQAEITADPVKGQETDVVETDVDVENPDELEGEDNTTVTTTFNPADAEAIYSDVLGEIIDYIATADEIIDGYTGIGEIVLYNGSDMAYKEIGFLEMDVTGDDIPELLIADPNYELGASNILQLYTIIDGKPVQVVEGWARNRQYLLKDGRIYNEGSSGAGNSTSIVYKVNSDGTITIDECFFTDYESDDAYDVVVFKSNGSLNREDAEKVDMSVEDFWLLQDSHLSETSEVEFIPLSNFAYAVVADEVGGEWNVNVPYVLFDVSTNDDTATYIQIYANRTIKNVKLIKMSDINFDNDGNMTYGSSEIVGKADCINQYEAALIKVNFIGDMPEYAISFTEDGSDIKVYAIGVSGMDGSIYLEEME